MMGQEKMVRRFSGSNRFKTIWIWNLYTKFAPKCPNNNNIVVLTPDHLSCKNSYYNRYLHTSEKWFEFIEWNWSVHFRDKQNLVDEAWTLHTTSQAWHESTEHQNNLTNNCDNKPIAWFDFIREQTSAMNQSVSRQGCDQINKRDSTFTEIKDGALQRSRRWFWLRYMKSLFAHTLMKRCGMHHECWEFSVSGVSY